MEEYKVKKKKPLWRRFLRWIFGIIFSIALTLGGFCLYLYFRYQINVIDVINQVKILNQPVDVDTLASNQFTETDLANAQTKIDNIASAENALKLSDKEVAAYFNNALQTQEGGIPVTIGSTTINLVDYGFEIVQMQFNNIPENNGSTKYTDFNIILKIELQKFKQEQMTGFVKGLVAKIMPNNLYFSCNLEINKTTDGYETTSKFLTINNLSKEQTTSIFNTFNTFIGIGTSDAFNKNISDSFVKTMIGEGGLYYQLKNQSAATGYSFEFDGTNNNFVIYIADVEEHHSITYHDGDESEIEYYTITDNTFAPKQMQKTGYNFLGWFDGNEEGANKITSIDATQLQDIELYARWQIIEYNISYTLNGGTEETNPTKYTIETETFTLINPSKENFEFIGWTGSNGTTKQTEVTITKGSTGDKNFIANFSANSYSIIYKDQNNEEFSGSLPSGYPQNHTYDETTVLPIANKIGHSFNGWFLNPECDGNAITQIDATVNSATIVYAKWTINQYTLTLKDGTNILFKTTQDYGTPIETQATPEKTGYTFTGWSETIPTTMPAQDKTIYANFNADQYTLSFDSNGGNHIDDTTITYNHTYGTLPIPQRNGYEFVGWFTNNSFETQVTATTVVRTTGNVEIVANWEIIEYTISYELNGGTTIGENPTKYTIETETFTLTNPTKSSLEFLGWEGTGLSELTLSVTISKGSTGNKEFSAIYNDTRVLTIVVDGNTIGLKNFNYGETIDPSTVINPEEIGMSGYSVEKWYSDPAMHEEFDFTQSLYGSVNIYGSWDYLTDKILCYPYLNTFEALTENDIYQINTQEQLMAYIDYVRFYNVTKQVKLKINYTGSTRNEILSAIEAAYNALINITEFQTLSEAAYNTCIKNTQNCGLFYINTDNFINEAKYVFDQAKQYTYAQQDYALKESPLLSERHFNIDKVSKTLQVATSEQLVWALENGYKPTFQNFANSNHSAETIYNKAKTILSQICTDEMNNLQKVKAIYEWLILNVQYDNYAADQSEHMQAREAKEYDAWFADGVFNNNKAVCEGIAKAFIIMAKIENIPAVMVVDNTHAWNRVYLDGVWYGLDATHGNVLSTSSHVEILTYSSFLFTDQFKTQKGHTATNYSEFVANTYYNYYENVTYSYNEQSFDLQINSAEELTLLLQCAKALSPSINTSQYSVEFALNSSDLQKYNLQGWLNIAKLVAGVNVTGNYSFTDTNGNTVYSLIVNKAA